MICVVGDEADHLRSKYLIAVPSRVALMPVYFSRRIYITPELTHSLGICVGDRQLPKLVAGRGKKKFVDI